MKLRRLTIRNLRLYGDKEQVLNFATDKNVIVFLGDNGAGKTSLLYGCTVALSQFFDVFPNISKKEFVFDDIRNSSNSQKADFMHVGVELDVPDHDCIPVDIYRKGNSNTVPSSIVKPIKEYAQDIKNKIDNNEQVVMPVLAYYGTERGQISAPERRRDFSRVFPRWASYQDALDSATDFKRFFTWYERNEDEERREQLSTKNLKYKSYVLEAVRMALNRLFEGYLANPRVEIKPLRFVMDDIRDPKNKMESRIERMSDGYRITIAMVADIAARMAEANPSSECSGLNNPLDTNGMVFIDEVDLHLHPKLQREILAKLTSIFPNVQFVVTTHSPNVIIGALDKVQVVKLDNGVIDADINVSRFQNYDISLMLL